MSQNERVREEVEALEAILLDDISITYNDKDYPELVKSTIFPSTANEVDKQYVCVTLEIRLPENYPDCEPITQLRNPRGLDDSTINNLYRSIKEKCNEYLGQPVIYELIELRCLHVLTGGCSAITHCTTQHLTPKPNPSVKLAPLKVPAPTTLSA